MDEGIATTGKLIDTAVPASDDESWLQSGRSLREADTPEAQGEQALEDKIQTKWPRVS